MTSLAHEPLTVEQDAPRQKYRHRLCVTQVQLRVAGHPGQTLCGRTLDGPRRRNSGTPRCFMCEELRPGHRAHCDYCLAQWGPLT